MFTKSLIAATFGACATAALIPRTATGSFTMLAIDSGSTIQYATINANGQYFWIGKPPSSSCPDVQGITCPPGNVTALTAYDVNLSTDTEVPGGQFVYVAVDGALGYTIPHSGVVPTGGATGPFEYTPGSSSGNSIGSLDFDGKGFYACPTDEEEIYQIYADSIGFLGVDCLGIAIATVEYDGLAAWEY